jgi:hypothetical protein
LCCSVYWLFCDVLCIVCVYMCTVLLPPGGYPIAVKYIIYIITYIISYIIYRIISYIILYGFGLLSVDGNHQPNTPRYISPTSDDLIHTAAKVWNLPWSQHCLGNSWKHKCILLIVCLSVC